MRICLLLAVCALLVPVATVRGFAPPPAQDASLPRLGAEDDRLLGRLLPHVLKAAEERHEARLQKLAEEIRAYDPEAPEPVGADKAGFVLAGTAIAAAIGYIVKKIITAILWSILIAAVIYWFKAHWLQAVIVFGGLLLGMTVWSWLIARASCKATGGK